MKRTIYTLIIVVVLLLLAMGSCRKAGTWLIKEDVPDHADVMVMLTGRIADRVLQVYDLYRDQVSGKVLIVEENIGSEVELQTRGVRLIRESTQARNALISMGVPPDSILILAGDAASTQMEAECVRDFIQQETGIDTLLLVTSSSHSLRAFRIFKAAFASLENGPVLYCSPSKYTEFHAASWWRSREDIQTVVFEYVKMANFLLFEKRKLRSGRK